MLELVFRVCVRQRKKIGAGIRGGGPPWAHEAGGAPRGVGRDPHPPGQGVTPLWNFLRSVFFIYSENDFRQVSRILELCRIGL